MLRDVREFVEWAAGNRDESALFAKLEATLANNGFPYWAFGSLWGDATAFQKLKAPAVRLNYPELWVQRYFDAGYDRIDPVVQITPYVQTSITWTELRHYRPAIFDDAAVYGLKSGLTVPLRAANGLYVLCMVSNETQEFGPVQRSWLELLAHGFFQAYIRVRELTPSHYGLSQNTLDVIRLSMAGLEPREIAQRLDITPHGVYWCLKDAKKRLGCSTQAQVYLRCIQQGIVVI